MCCAGIGKNEHIFGIPAIVVPSSFHRHLARRWPGFVTSLVASKTYGTASAARQKESIKEIPMIYSLNSTYFFTHFAGNSASSGNSDHKPGLLRRIVRAMVESRQRQTDREIARFLARSGGRLTDDMERRLTQYLLSRNCTIRD